MTNIITELSKYLIILLFALYTICCFFSIGKKHSGLFVQQRVYMFIIHFLAYITMFLRSGEIKYLAFYAVQVILFTAVMLVYWVAYPKMSKLIINNMCMLLAVGFIILSRLAFAKSLKQFAIVTVSITIAMLVPVIIRKWTFLHRLTWLYAIIGIVFLSMMKLAGIITYGASISFSIGGITIQPVEFVKIIFVFFLAAFLSKRHGRRDIIIVSAVAAVHILLLVWSRELGGALIFFVVYLSLIYVATNQPLYFLAGLVGGTGAGYIAYQLFNHVRVRFLTWSTPFSTIKKDTSQISQSLFAIGTGSWFGMGLMEGIPDKIPVSAEDMVFSAITEELGMFFSLCLILICLSTFIMFINLATKITAPFYKLLALGFGIEYMFQVFLTIGGGTKFIPLTGVTLPLVSYGGSSVFCSLMIFAIIQGIYILKQDEAQEDEDEDEDEYEDDTWSEEASVRENYEQYEDGFDQYNDEDFVLVEDYVDYSIDPNEVLNYEDE